MNSQTNQHTNHRIKKAPITTFDKAVVATFVVIALGGGLLVANNFGTTQIEQAAATCQIPNKLSDDGHSLTMVATTEAELKDVSCISVQVGMPDYAWTNLLSTRMIDGKQRASWDNFEAVWSYSPATGLYITFVEE